MTGEEAPRGTLVAIGHPGNGVVARKDEDEVWRYLGTGVQVGLDDRRAMVLLWMPSSDLASSATN